MDSNFLKLQKKINIRFNDLNLLKKSLTHKSFDSINSYEKLEFLGDRILGLVISEKLLEIYPEENEGSLDKKLASLVNKNKCLEIAKSISLENYISVAKKKGKEIKIEDKIISDACEALIGAIYLDKGLLETKRFIIKLWKDHLKASKITYIDAKTKLQEYSLKKFKKLPIYKLIENSGPRHKPIFNVAVRLENSKFINAKGNSKKDAEQKAATLFMKSLEK
ncbi:MAG: ribonuclease III [Candidatus Pelagibacter sp.]|nr:ribonuclease III [Candidatus Pelagibacter sp.]|tara:strand:+ start:17 stop:682 length:666 start_codon:yes stop_codon:yes gene_type:complete